MMKKLFHPMNSEALQARAKNAFRVADAHLAPYPQEVSSGMDKVGIARPSVRGSG